MKDNRKKIQDIVIYKDKDKTVEVQLNSDTVWLSLSQIAYLFDVQKPAISKHIKHIFDSGELSREGTVSILETVQKEGNREVKRKITYYNLDVVISVGYRVNSKRATQFRIWATQVLKNYLIKGYAINRKRLTEEKIKELEETVKFIKDNIKNLKLSISQFEGILEIIERYANVWKWIEEYDSGKIEGIKTVKEKEPIKYDEAKNIIEELKKYLISKSMASEIFGIERDKGLFKSALNTIYQTFSGNDLYPSFEEKSANLLYLIIKNHPFVDGNKRIGAILFLRFLYGNIGKEELYKRFNDNALTSLCYLIAASPPNQKDQLINLIMNFISLGGKT